MNQHKNRLAKLEKETTEDDPAIIEIQYCRDWRADNPQDVAEVKYIRPGHGWITKAEAEYENKQDPT